MTENIVIIDWLTFTCREKSAEDLIQMLGLESLGFVDCKGHYGYKSAKQYGGIWIMTDGFSADMGVCVEMSGQGCRQYETSGAFDLDCLCSCLAYHSDTYHITRLDVAFDDVDHAGGGLLDMSVIDDLLRNDMYISRFRSKSGQWSGRHSSIGASADAPLALSCYLGSPQSNTRFRIYDKSLERGGLDYHWTRFEIQLRGDAPLAFLNDTHPLGEKFYGLINNDLRFLTPNSGDSNRRRWSSPDWWTNFLQSVLKISVFTKKDVEYNMTRLEKYVFGQAGRSLYTYLCCKGISEFNRELREYMRDKELSDKHRQLISEYEASAQKRLSRYYQNQPIGFTDRSGYVSDFTLSDCDIGEMIEGR